MPWQSDALQRRYPIGSWVATVCAVAVVVTGGWASHQMRLSINTPDAFYEQPDHVPDEPGELLRVEPWPGQAPQSAAVQRILHTTTDVHGDAAVASGLVITPDPLPDGPRPVVLWSHGTTGVARNCAPSLMDNMFEIQGIPAVQEAVERGWVIVATDYPGHGAPGDFPYLIGGGEGRSTLDSGRAAAQIEGLETSGDVVIWGHSQGGHAALWAGALADDYAPELTVHGVSAISPAADPLAFAGRIFDSDLAETALGVFISWVVIPYSQTYDDVHLDDYLAAPTRSMMMEMSGRCVSEPGLLVGALGGLALSWDRPMFETDIEGTPLQARMAENRAAGPWSVPLLLGWGSDDEVIPAEFQHDYRDDLCAEEVDLTWQEYPGYSHMQIVEDGSDFIPILVEWTEERFGAGEADDAAPVGVGEVRPC